MTQTTAYTTLEASVFASKGLADCIVLVVDDEQSSCLLITTILSDWFNCLATSLVMSKNQSAGLKSGGQAKEGEMAAK